MAVDFSETIKYGSKLLLYILPIAIVAGIFLTPGALLITPTEPLAGSHPVAGIILIAIGLLILTAGMMGVLYKIISDGVERGREATE